MNEGCGPDGDLEQYEDMNRYWTIRHACLAFQLEPNDQQTRLPSLYKTQAKLIITNRACIALH